MVYVQDLINSKLYEMHLLYSRLFSNGIYFQIFRLSFSVWRYIQLTIMTKPTIKIFVSTAATQMSWCMLSIVTLTNTAGVVVKWQDKRLPDSNGPLSFIVPAEAQGYQWCTCNLCRHMVNPLKCKVVKVSDREAHTWSWHLCSKHKSPSTL